MTPACRDFRRSWLEDETPLEGPSASSEHLASCDACSAWLRRTRLQVGTLRSLERLIAPAALDDRLSAVESEQAVEVSSSQARVLAQVRGLPRLVAPAELDERMRAGAWAVESPVLRLVRSLARLPAPAVLERLVGEELADPRKAQAARYVGTLDRLSAPRKLEQRVALVLRGGLEWNRTRVALVAAALLTLLAFPLVREAPARVYDYELVHDSSGKGLSPIARSFGESLAPLQAAEDPWDEAVADVGPDGNAPDESTPEATGDLPEGTGEPSTGADAGARVDPAPSSRAPASGGAGASGSAASTAGGGTSATANPLALLYGDPLATMAHEGRRRVSFFEPGGGVPKSVAYLERVVTDGQGRFAIEPLEALTPVLPDEATFLLRMQAREGFIRRYRDFQVRDFALFRRTYAVEVGGSLVVAGRDCRAIVATNRSTGARFELAVDGSTGLILRSDEFDETGERVASVEYIEYHDVPNLSNVLFHQARNEERSYDPDQRLAPQLGFKPRRPRTLPLGYELLEVATVAEPDSGRGWLKLTFGDGVRPLFFLQPTPPGPTIVRGEEGDKVVVMRWGAVLMAQAWIRGHEFIAVGRVSEEELLDLIESALP